MEPILKWPGGKRKLTSFIRKYIPSTFGKYYEPFCGGAALFFSLEPDGATISDANNDLINCYKNVALFPHQLIKVLKGMKNSEESYYATREWIPGNDLERAAKFLYLSKLSFNGIYRVNLKGEFNVPYGYKTHLEVCDDISILKSSSLLLKNQIDTFDFSKVIEYAKNGDLIYFDPPYTVAHKNNGFIKYNDKIFSWEDQKRLSLVARKLQEIGCYVLISNADHSSIRELYPTFDEEIILRSSVISANKENRKNVTESLFYGTKK